MRRWWLNDVMKALLYIIVFKTCACFLLAPQSHLYSNRHSVGYSLNRFLFDPEEVDKDSNSVTLSRDDYRTVHAAKILGLSNGATIRAGIVSDNGSSRNGLLTDHAIIEWIPEGKVKKKEPLGNGQPPGSMKVHLQNTEPPPPCQRPSVALLLALPRPLQLGRMLPMIAQMGVCDLVLTQAKKVPRDYFGSHLFRKPEILRERLIEGLCQAGDVQLPTVHIVRNLKHFLQNDLDTLFPLKDYARVIAHPQRNNNRNNLDDETNKMKVLRMRDIQFPSMANNDDDGSTTRRILLAVGPEGGWEEPEELDRFQQHHFQQVTLGSRVLRSDCAVVSLLALAHDTCQMD